jgi:predicted dehydrogenase/threonine dehydrogenase-like Zn-dependent dehydrogenase
MRQLVQDVSSGVISVEEVPAPARPAGSLLVATRASVISAGTERAVMELGNASLVGKARARPDLVRKVIDTARTEGVASTYAKVRGRLDEPNGLGYSLSGMVLEADADAPAAVGDLIACAGAGYAVHGEVVAVPHNLCARIPDGVPAEDAAYGTVATIALHGVRLAKVGLGDVVAVIGLGMVGQLTLELVAAAGAVAVGLDLDPGRVEVARAAGFFASTDPHGLVDEAARLTDGRGADAALVTAASKSAAPLRTAIAATRERAVVSIVGDVPVEASRNELFAKEVQLVVSRSYGPGRYDPEYEERGRDYPAAYVRWTEGRNLAEVVRLMAAGALRPSRLTSHRFSLEQGPEAYALLDSDEPSMGIVLQYPERADAGPRSVALPARRRRLRGLQRERMRIGVIGAGTFARSVLLPALRGSADITAVATATGMSAKATAERFGARLATTDVDELIASADVDAVLIATRHDTHAAYAAAALRAGKHVFVEKPLAIDDEQLQRLEGAVSESDAVLMVGFNRRFAPLASRLRDELGGAGPLTVTYRVNAGVVPPSHWTQDREIGGGRLVGEGCHFIDFASYLAGTPPVRVFATTVGGGSVPPQDRTATTVVYADGSVAQILYSALGDTSLPKERVEVLSERGAAVLDDFRELTLHRHGRQETVSGRRDKGHRAELDAFVRACRTGDQPWAVADMTAVTRATFAMRDRPGQPVELT